MLAQEAYSVAKLFLPWRAFKTAGVQAECVGVVWRFGKGGGGVWGGSSCSDRNRLFETLHFINQMAQPPLAPMSDCLAWLIRAWSPLVYQPGSSEVNVTTPVGTTALRPQPQVEVPVAPPAAWEEVCASSHVWEMVSWNWIPAAPYTGFLPSHLHFQSSTTLSCGPLIAKLNVWLLSLNAAVN